MYCAKCGKEVDSGDGYCPNCGANIRKNVAGAQEPHSQVMQRLRMVPKTYYAAILGQIMSVFLVGGSMFKVSYKMFTSYTYEMTMFESKEMWKTLFILGYLAATLAMLLPIVLDKPWQRWHFVPGMVMPVAALIWMFAVLINAAGESDWGSYEELASSLGLSAGLTANAWLFLLISAGCLTLDFLAMRDIINGGNTPKKVQPNQKTMAKVVGVTILPPDKVKNGRDVRLTFELADGSKLNLLEKSEYQAKLGDKGILTWNEEYVVFFEKSDE